MNTNRIIGWAIFVAVVGLIVWGMIAASNKAKNELTGAGLPDQVVATDWVKGTSTAPVTLVEYSDFQCPACGGYFPLVEKLVAENPTLVRLVYRHFPLQQHVHAMLAAQASEAAGNQGKFWEMYKKLFETQADWDKAADAKAVFTGYAQELGLDMVKFAADIDSQVVKDKINAQALGGARGGVNSTPTFYVNGKKIQNPQSYDEFKKLIENAATPAA
ncbi:MAG: thioredoxin domain-containing protein [Patescibacteria group bacterium]